MDTRPIFRARLLAILFLLCGFFSNLVAQDYYPIILGQQYYYKGYNANGIFQYSYLKSIEKDTCCNNLYAFYQKGLRTYNSGSTEVNNFWQTVNGDYIYSGLCNMNIINYFKKVKDGDEIKDNFGFNNKITFYGNLTVPSGSYASCYLIKQTFEGGIGQYWYYVAPNVGVVKYEHYRTYSPGIWSLVNVEELNSYTIPSQTLIDINHITKKDYDRGSYVTISSTPTDKHFRVSADGSKSSVFMIKRGNDLSTKVFKNIAVRIEQDKSQSNPVTYGKLTFLKKDDNFIFYEYQHPENMTIDDSLFRTFTLSFYDSLATSCNIIRKSLPLRVYRAPVLLVHGLWSDASAFEVMAKELRKDSKLYFNDQVYLADYSNSNANSFYFNSYIKGVVINDIDVVLEKMIKKHKIAAGKVDIVGHSMGGLLSRMYIQDKRRYLRRNDVHKLITCNTPHSGSQFANYLLDTPNGEEGTLCNLLGWVGNSCTAGAVSDLQVDSRMFDNNNNISLNNPQNLNINVPCHSIFTQTVEAISGIPEKYNKTIQALFSTGCSDAIVECVSQIGGIVQNSFIDDQIHIGSTENPNVISKVTELLKSPINPLTFAKWYKPIKLEYIRPKENNQVNSVIINSSKLEVNLIGNKKVAQGNNLNLNIDKSSNFNTANINIYANNHQYFDEELQNNQSSFSISTNQLPIGNLTITAIGHDTLNNYYLADTIKVEILPNSSISPTSIKASYNSLVIEKGKEKGINIFLVYTNEQVEILNSNIFKYSSKTQNSSLKDFSIKGINIGFDTLTLMYNNLTTKVYVEIKEPICSYLSDKVSLVHQCEDKKVSLSIPLFNVDKYWNTGDTTNATTITKPGIYSVVVYDSKGCTASASINILDTNGCQLNDNACNATWINIQNDCSPTLGTNVGATTSTIPSLSEIVCSTYGAKDVWYTFTPTSSGKVIIEMQSMGMIDGLLAVYRSKTDCSDLQYITCDDDGNGMMPRLSMSVVSGQVYYVRVWGYNGTTGAFGICVKNDNATACPTISIKTNVINTSCGLSNGAITAEPNGGTAPYTYKWNTGSTNATITGLNIGEYSVVVTDSKGCTATTKTNVATASVNFSVNLTEVKAACPKDNSNITTSVSGGVSPYFYYWSNGSNQANLTSVATGTYNVTVTDSRGCKAFASKSVSTSVCLALYDPVCGSNGKQYASKCEALCDGITSWTNGPCNTTASCKCTDVNSDICENFQSYSTPTLGSDGIYQGFLGPQSYCWTTWSGNEGGAEDGLVRQLSDGSKYLRINGENSTGGGPQDVVLQLGNRTTGKYQLKMKFLVKNQDKGYFNLLSAFPTSSDEDWAQDVYFNGNGAGKLKVNGSVVASFSYPTNGQWFDIVQDIDLNTGINILNIAGTQVAQWTMANKKISAIDFYPVDNTYRFFIDDIKFEQKSSTTPCPTINVSLTNEYPKCNIRNIISTVSGGTSPYAYLWNNGSNGVKFIQPPAGVSSLTVTDSKGCKGVGSIDIPSITTFEFIYDPVCGSDGKQYDSPCLALNAGITSFTYGPCSCSFTNPNLTTTCDDFQSYNAPISDVNGFSSGTLCNQTPCWATWNNNPGSSEDATVRQAPDGGKYLRFSSTNSDGGPQDVILKLGDRTSGVYQLKFKLLVKLNYQAYYNILSQFPTISNADWAQHVFFDGNGTGRVIVNQVTTSFSYPTNSSGIWFDVIQTFDLLTGSTTLNIAGTTVRQWTMTNKKLSALDFYPANSSNLFFVDDVCFTKISNLSNNNGSIKNNTLGFGNGLRIYPNPTSPNTVLNIEYESSVSSEKPIKLCVIDMMGRCIISQDVTAIKGSNIFSIDIPNLAKGIYTVSLQHEEQQLVEKLIILE